MSLFEKAREVLGPLRARMVWSGLVRKARSRGIPVEDLRGVRGFLGLEPCVSPIPLQQPDNYFPGLPTQAWHRVEDFPWTRQLEENFPQIRAELNAVTPGAQFHDHETALGVAGQWRVYYLYYVGRRVDAHCRQCPRTAQLIESIPGHEVGLAYFSRLQPGAHLNAHCGSRNTALRCHLGLRIPEGCEIRVGSETRGWTEGKCMMFDDSIEHEVWNRSNQNRYVLILDSFHPDLAANEKWALNEINQSSWMARQRFRRMQSKIAANSAPGT